MANSNNEYQTIISKIDLLNEKLELYKQTNDEINNSMRAEIKAYQDANKQQLNPVFFTKRAIALTRSSTKSRFDPDVRFCLKTTVCCESSCLHQNQ